MNRAASNADVFRAISDPNRRRLLDLLARGERPVSHLAKSFEVSLPAVSQHLKVLKDVALVKERRAGRQRLYRMNPEPLKEVLEWVGYYERFWTEKLDALGEHLKGKP